MWGTYVHMYTKYEVPMSNPVARGGVHRNDDCARRTKHDCVRLFLVENQMSQKV